VCSPTARSPSVRQQRPRQWRQPHPRCGTTLALGARTASATALSPPAVPAPAITGTGTITASTGFFLNHTGDTTVDAVLAGAGGLLKSQANGVNLTGANSYTGTTEIQAGTLSFNSITNVGGGASALGNAANAEDGIIRMGLTTAATTLHLHRQWSHERPLHRHARHHGRCHLEW
jgi:autotransporter-associated beta strand protein